MNVRRMGRVGGVVLGLGLLLTGVPAQAVITRLTPLEDVLKESQFIFTAKVEKIDPEKPSLVLAARDALKGTAPFARLPVNLTGDAEAKKLDHTAKLLKRLAVNQHLVVFVTRQDKQYIAFAYAGGTWFQMTARDAGGDAPVWSFAHCEPYLRRTYKGTTAELKDVVVDGLAGKKKPPPPNPKEEPGLGPEAAPEEKKEGALPNADGPVFAVIPSVALGGILSLLAMLFPAVFGGLTGQLKRWLAVISVASLNSTILFVHDWFASSLQGSWWGTPTALWVTMTALTALGVLWAWRRHLTAVAEAPADEAGRRQPPFLPGRGEHLLLWVLSGVGVVLFGVCLLLGYTLTATPWSFVLALWVGIWVATLYALLARLRAGGRPALSAEGVMLWAMLPASLALGLTGAGATTAAPLGTVEGGTTAGGARLLGEAWAFRPEGTGFIVSSPLVTEEFVYTAAAHGSAFRPFGKLYCLDAATGRKVWEFNDDGGMKQVFSSPCLADGRLYVGEGFHQDFGCKLYCLDAATGKKLWEFGTESHTESSPSVAGGKVFFGAGDDGVYCLDAATGKELWHFNDGLHVDAPPLVVGNRLYAGSGVGDVHKRLELVCLDAATGKPVWRVPTDLPAWNAPAFADGRLYVGLGNGNFLESDRERPRGALLCVRADDGARQWLFDVPDGVLCRPAVDATSVYFGARDGTCYCLERGEGKRRWTFELGSPSVASPALAVSADGRRRSLFAVGGDGRLCCLDPEKGELSWTFNVSKYQARMLSSPTVWPHAGDRRRVYVGAGLNGNTAGVLYCLEDHWPAP